MKKKPIFGIICLVIIPAVIIFGDQVNPDNLNDGEIDGSNVFHIRLADPTLYEKGVYVDYFQVEKGVYEFRFVASGNSPSTLSIELWHISGDRWNHYSPFSEDFVLMGTLVDEELSSWHVWDYLGEKRFHFDPPDDSLTRQTDGEISATIQIVISPNRNYDGPVSVDLIKLR